MPVLDAQGHDAADEWLADALFDWLSDERVRKAMFRAGRATPKGLAVVGGMLHAHLEKRRRMKMPALRAAVLNCIQERTVRICIARRTLLAQLENFEREPDTAPAPDTSAKIRGDLQTLRQELESRQESEELIVRPW